MGERCLTNVERGSGYGTPFQKKILKIFKKYFLTFQ